MQKKKSKISLKKTKDIALSIQFSLDGFSFCVSDVSLQNDVYFKEYIFERSLKTPEELLKKIETIFKTDANLQLEFSSVEVIHSNYLNTFVPNKYFKEDVLESYLNFNIKTLNTDFLTFDDLSNINAKNVYIPYVNINNYLFQNFGEFTYKHHLTVLLEKLLTKNISQEKTMFVNVSKKYMDILVLENKKLVLSNSFSYQTKEDFIYYILFVAEQLELSAEDFNVYFMGDITKESKFYEITYKYIRNVHFLESNNEIFNDLEIPKHSNYILLGL